MKIVVILLLVFASTCRNYKTAHIPQFDKEFNPRRVKEFEENVKRFERSFKEIDRRDSISYEMGSTQVNWLIFHMYDSSSVQNADSNFHKYTNMAGLLHNIAATYIVHNIPCASIEISYKDRWNRLYQIGYNSQGTFHWYPSNR